MKIGIVAHVKYPISEPFAGGLEMHTHALACSLRERGHQVVVFAATTSDPNIGSEAICDQTEIDSVGVAEAPDITFFREHHAYLHLMCSLRHRDFDIVHNNSLHYLPVAMADTLPMPVLTALHTPPFSWLESGIRLCRGANARFVAVSSTMRALWSAVLPVDAVVPNGIDLRRFRHHPSPSDIHYAVWTGRIVPEKGLHYAIDAAALAGMDLRIAGPISNPEYFNVEIVPRLGTGAVYVGHLQHKDLAELVGGARVAICTPCWEEPFGLVVAEALACGVPVAGFDRGAMPELLTPDCGVLARPQDSNSLACAIRQAMELSREACRARALNCWDAERMVDAYERLYHAAITNQTAQ